VELGAGRLSAEDDVDSQAGIILLKKIGDKVNKDENLIEIRTNQKGSIAEVQKKIGQAISIENDPPEKLELILKEIN
jgi:pyrimidine-nucleoside phosphorylase